MVERVCAMHAQLDPAKYGFLPNPSGRYERWLGARAQDAHSVFLVAEREAAKGEAGGLAGFVVATVEEEIPIYRLKAYGFIHDLWVEPESRHQGIGRRLVVGAVERLKQMGVEQVRCDTAAANESARRLFEACGFRASVVEMLREMGDGE